MADADVDAVYVATPHPMHSPCAQLALRAGKPALVEKPFTVSAAEAEELVALARSAGLFLMEAMWTRWLPHIVAIRRAARRGRAGRDRAPSSPTTASGSRRTASSGCSRRELASGALLDLGVYPVAFASMVLGTPERIVSLVTPAPDGVDEHDLDGVRLRGRRSGAADTARRRPRARPAARSSGPRRGSRSMATSTGRRRSA